MPSHSLPHNDSAEAGLAQWAFEDSPLHAELLADGWEESRVRKYVSGSGFVVLMVKVESA